jgi:hypothetical protein
VATIRKIRKIRDEQILPAARPGNTPGAMGALFNPEIGAIPEAQQNTGSKTNEMGRNAANAANGSTEIASQHRPGGPGGAVHERRGAGDGVGGGGAGGGRRRS